MNIILSFGSNLGDREKLIKQAYKEIEDLIGKMIVCSSIIETKAWGFESKEMFLNSVAVFNTKKTPTECLSIIHNIEKSLGRVRNEDQVGYSSRTIDIDILFYDSLVLETPSLTIPHPPSYQKRVCSYATQTNTSRFYSPNSKTKDKRY